MTDIAIYKRSRRELWRERASKWRVPWTCVEVRRAVEMRDRNKSYAQIALCLGRTPDAVAARLRPLSLKGAQ